MDCTNSVNFKSRTYNNVSENTNLLDKYRNQTPQIKPGADKITIDKDLIADMKYCKDKIALGNIIEGHINNKPAVLKVVSNHEEETWFEGVIDKNYVLLHNKNNEYDGKYGNSEFYLTIDYKEPSKISRFFNQKIMGKAYIPEYFKVQGTIGNKSINISLPNIKVPDDEETKNILTMILEDNGLKAQTICGEIKSLKFAPSAIKNLKKRAEKREQTINNDIKPIFMQGFSTATGMIIGSIVSALMFKFGLKK